MKSNRNWDNNIDYQASSLQLRDYISENQLDCSHVKFIYNIGNSRKNNSGNCKHYVSI